MVVFNNSLITFDLKFLFNFSVLGAVGWARPDILPSTPTPPPTFAEAIASRETDVVTTTTITTEHRISQGVVAALAERTIPAAVDISM